MALDDIALKHHRTAGSIKVRVMSNGLNMMTDKNLTLEEVSNMIHISEQELFQYKQKQDEKKSKRKLTPSSASYDATITQDIVSILYEFRDYLKIISEN